MVFCVARTATGDQTWVSANAPFSLFPLTNTCNEFILWLRESSRNTTTTTAWTLSPFNQIWQLVSLSCGNHLVLYQLLLCQFITLSLSLFLWPFRGQCTQGFSRKTACCCLNSICFLLFKVDNQVEISHQEESWLKDTIWKEAFMKKPNPKWPNCKVTNS